MHGAVKFELEIRVVSVGARINLHLALITDLSEAV